MPGTLSRQRIWSQVAPHDLRNVPPTVQTGLKNASVALYKTVNRAVKRLQNGRMRSVLHSMSDEQLNQIGLKRSEINRRAAYLITGNHDDF